MGKLICLFRVGRPALSCWASGLSRLLLSPGFRLATFGPCGRFPRFLGSPLHGRGLPPWGEALWPSSLVAKSDYTIAISMASEKFKFVIKKAKKEARPSGQAMARRGLARSALVALCLFAEIEAVRFATAQSRNRSCRTSREHRLILCPIQ